MNFTTAGGDLAGTYPNPLVAPAVVTSLPSNPVDGQQCYYLADNANGIVWHLRYRAASTSTHKWEFVGGPVLMANPGGNLTTSSTTAVALTGGPSITVPLPGDYEVLFGVYASAAAATVATTMNCQIARNGTPTGYVAIVVSSGQYDAATVSMTELFGNMVVGDVLSLVVVLDKAQSCTFTNGWIRLAPRRVG
jgi:hypothetical protein